MLLPPGKELVDEAGVGVVVLGSDVAEADVVTGGGVVVLEVVEGR